MPTKHLWSKSVNDECYTPAYAVEPILPYIPPGATVWCPFDTAESEFVRLIGRTNPVVSSHIAEGRDFFSYEPPRPWDVIVSNPPFSGKARVFARALQLGRPFALLMTNVWLNDRAPARLFGGAGAGLQLLLLDRRINFKGREGKPTFSCSYFCRGLLPRDIVVVRLYPRP